jgi:hypothetical protein
MNKMTFKLGAQQALLMSKIHAMKSNEHPIENPFWQ